MGGSGIPGSATASERRTPGSCSAGPLAARTLQVYQTLYLTFNAASSASAAGSPCRART